MKRSKSTLALLLRVHGAKGVRPISVSDHGSSNDAARENFKPYYAVSVLLSPGSFPCFIAAWSIPPLLL